MTECTLKTKRTQRVKKHEAMTSMGHSGVHGTIAKLPKDEHIQQSNSSFRKGKGTTEPFLGRGSHKHNLNPIFSLIPIPSYNLILN